jgi:hypothetical protein
MSANVIPLFSGEKAAEVQHRAAAALDAEIVRWLLSPDFPANEPPALTAILQGDQSWQQFLT